MKKTLLAALAWVLLVGVAILLPLSSAHALESFAVETEMKQYSSASGYEGYVLFNGSSDPTIYSSSPTGVAYLVDRQGYMVNKWTGVSFSPRLLENGDLWSVGQMRSWEGTLKWQYTPPAGYNIHHEGARIWNSRISAYTYLMLFSRTATRAEITAAGGDPGQTGSLTGMDGIIEVQQTGATTGNIIWEWRFLDHACQSNNSAWPNYVPSLSDTAAKGKCDLFYQTNEQRRNASAGGPGIASDWHHATSIDYNETRDEIVINSRNWSELYVISHGGTTAEARGTAGDFLWRYGNGGAYGLSATSSPTWTLPSFKNAGQQSLFAPDQATWIGTEWNAPHGDATETWTAAGAQLTLRGTASNAHILVFDTGKYYPTGSRSVIVELNPVDAGGAYVAESTAGWNSSSQKTTIHSPGHQNDFFNPGVGSVQRMANGGSFICSGLHGHVLQLTTASGISTPQWEYIIPVIGKKVLTSRTDDTDGDNASPARARFYSTAFMALTGKATGVALASGTTITGNPLRNIIVTPTDDFGFSCGSCSTGCTACDDCGANTGRTCCTTPENCAVHCAATQPPPDCTPGAASGCCPGANSTTCSGSCESCEERCDCSSTPTAGQCNTYCQANHPVDCGTTGSGCCAPNLGSCDPCPTCGDSQANGGCGCAPTTCESLNCVCPTCADPVANNGCGIVAATCSSLNCECPTCADECECVAPTVSSCCGPDPVCGECCGALNCGNFNYQSGCCTACAQCPTYDCQQTSSSCCEECRSGSCCPACPSCDVSAVSIPIGAGWGVGLCPACPTCPSSSGGTTTPATPATPKPVITQGWGIGTAGSSSSGGSGGGSGSGSGGGGGGY